MDEKSAPSGELDDLLVVAVGTRPATRSGGVGCIMLVAGRPAAEGVQRFEFQLTYFAPPITIEWHQGTMSVVLPADTAELLFRKGYARPMTDDEAEAYNGEKP